MGSHRVIAARERSGMTQKWVTSHRPDLAEMESADTLTDEQIAVAAKAYGVSECWLRGHTGQLIGGVGDVLLDYTDLPVHDQNELLEFAMSLGSCRECLTEIDGRGTMGAKGQNQ